MCRIYIKRLAFFKSPVYPGPKPFQKGAIRITQRGWERLFMEFSPVIFYICFGKCQNDSKFIKNYDAFLRMFRMM
jgi:hypothetical protein